MKILIPMKRDPAMLPPVVSVIRGLAELGHTTTLLCYHNSVSELELAGGKGISLVQQGSGVYPKAIVGRLRSTLAMYRKLWHLLGQRPSFDLVWMGAWDFPLFERLANQQGMQAPVVYQFHEYEPHRFNYCRKADYVVVPEENRAWLTYFGAGLRRFPFVLPNIPYRHPRQSDPVHVSKELRRLKGEGRSVVLYQGYPDFQKRCLSELIQATALLPQHCTLAVMPSQPLTDALSQRLRSEAERAGVGNRVCLLPTQPPPEHLHTVGQADVGVGLYRATSLNQVYCAPNRLYEFAGFGIPVVLPNYPGIARLAVECPGIQVCEVGDPADIARAVLAAIDPGRSHGYRAALQNFYRRHGDFLSHLVRLIDRISHDLGPRAA